MRIDQKYYKTTTLVILAVFFAYFSYVQDRISTGIKSFVEVSNTQCTQTNQDSNTSINRNVFLFQSLELLKASLMNDSIITNGETKSGTKTCSTTI